MIIWSSLPNLITPAKFSGCTVDSMCSNYVKCFGMCGIASIAELVSLIPRPEGRPFPTSSSSWEQDIVCVVIKIMSSVWI